MIRTHVFAAERTTPTTPSAGPGEGQGSVSRLWTCRDRGGEHPERCLAGHAGLLQADSYFGFNRLYEANENLDPLLRLRGRQRTRRAFLVARRQRTTKFKSRRQSL